jgi:hypothetical protein
VRLLSQQPLRLLQQQSRQQWVRLVQTLLLRAMLRCCCTGQDLRQHLALQERLVRLLLQGMQLLLVMQLLCCLQTAQWCGLPRTQSAAAVAPANVSAPAADAEPIHHSTLLLPLRRQQRPQAVLQLQQLLGQ